MLAWVSFCAPEAVSYEILAEWFRRWAYLTGSLQKASLPESIQQGAADNKLPEVPGWSDAILRPL